MKTNEILGFVAWVANRGSGGLVTRIRDLNEEFRDELAASPWLATIAWVAVTAFIQALLILFLLAGFGPEVIQATNPHLVASATYLSIAYFIVQGTRVLWNSYQRDRHRVFEILKDSEDEY
jgi:hypothetical protein